MMRRAVSRVVVCCATVAAFVGLAAVPAVAATRDVSVSPVLECSWKDDSGTWRSLFGYNSKNESTVEVPVGDRKAFKNSPSANAGQPTRFEPGRHVGVFVVQHSGTIVWALTGRTSTAPGKACRKPPVPAATSGIRGVLIIGVVSLLLVSTVGWFVRRRRTEGTTP